MTRTAFLALLLATALTIAAPAQVGHPAKGSWSGYWGTSDAAKRRILLVLDWRDQKITGVINPGPNQVPIEKADLDVNSWTLRLEASMPTDGGGKARFVTTGQLTNLGSWTTRTYAGTYVFGDERGRFTVTLN
ncbi:MAG TPA: hypothetical protein VM692_15260 [Gammaproteobacteria bacterium]|nr:hypothetical protein [Gammaproteobacteria bacterium]